METTMETPVAESWLSAPCLSGPQERPEAETPSQGNTYASLKPPCPAMPLENARDVIGLGDQKEVSVKPLRPHSTPATLMWLEENYEIAEGVCIPRSTLYMHYVDFCGRNGMQPVNAASFGKIIRQQFPQLTTRRLGTRGQSRYHYYGIAVRETSPYYDIAFSKKGISNAGDLKKEVVKQSSPYCQRSKVTTLLPEFPSVRELRLPSSVPEEKVATFVMMYRTHCQRVLDTIIRASFDEVQSFLLHFWQGMPSHITSVLGSNVIVNIVGVCDSILYRSISNVLLPTIVQPMPESLSQVVRKFAKDIETWVRMALEDLPDNLTAVKSDLAHRFSQTLRRQTSLSHMSQTTRMILHNSDISGQMLQDWRNIDLDGISRQTLYTMDHTYNCVTLELVTNLYREFESLLEEQSPIESYIDWLETMVDRCVVQPSRKRKLSTRRLARQFLLMWTAFGTRIMRDMTLHSAPSFGSYHLVRLMLDDYVLYLVETLYSEERMRELFGNISVDAPPAFPEVDDSFGDPDGNLNKIKWYNSPATNAPEVILGSSSMIITTSAQTTASDVINQTSPSQEVPDSNDMREGCIMGEEAVTSASPTSEGQMVHDYTAGSEHYSTMYSYPGTYDGRNGYRHGNNGALARQEPRTYAYPANQYLMVPQNSSESGHVDLSVTRVNSTRASTEGATVSGVDYSNSYVAYTATPRRADYGNYVYDQGSSPLLYPAGNCYYQAYEAPAVATAAYYNSRYKNKEEDSSPKVRQDEGTSEDKVTSTEGTPMSYSVSAATNTYVRA